MADATYKEVNPRVFNRNTEESRTRRTGGGGDYWKPQVGKDKPAKNVIRILPPHVNMADVIIQAKIHFSLGPDEKSAATCLAPFGEECPACALVDQDYKDAKSETDPEQQAALKKRGADRAAKYRFFANVVDMQKPESGVQRYAFGPDVDKKIRNCFYDDEGFLRDITYPKKGRVPMSGPDIPDGSYREGRDLIMNVGIKGGFNDYEVRAKENPSPLFDMDLLDKIEDLTELTKKPKREDIINTINGIRPQQKATAARSLVVVAPQGRQPVAAVAPTPGRPVGRPAVASAPAPQTEVDPRDALIAAMKEQLRQLEAEAPRPKVEAPASSVQDNGGHPYAAARTMIAALGFMSPIEITPEDTASQKKPLCYTKKTAPLDPMCQGCRLLLPCYTALNNLEA